MFRFHLISDPSKCIWKIRNIETILCVSYIPRTYAYIQVCHRMCVHKCNVNMFSHRWFVCVCIGVVFMRWYILIFLSGNWERAKIQQSNRHFNAEMSSFSQFFREMFQIHAKALVQVQEKVSACCIHLTPYIWYTHTHACTNTINDVEQKYNSSRSNFRFFYLQHIRRDIWSSWKAIPDRTFA